MFSAVFKPGNSVLQDVTDGESGASPARFGSTTISGIQTRGLSSSKSSESRCFDSSGMLISLVTCRDIRFAVNPIDRISSQSKYANADLPVTRRGTLKSMYVNRYSTVFYTCSIFPLRCLVDGYTAIVSYKLYYYDN